MAKFCDESRLQGELCHDYRKQLDTAFLYLCSGNPYAAYLSLKSFSGKLPVALYNKAICFYMVGGYDECFRLLQDAESLLNNTLCKSEIDSIPSVIMQWEYKCSPFLSPAIADTPDCILERQLLRLKAETAFRLHLYDEVRRISNSLGNKYEHINQLILKIESDDLQRNI